MNNSYYDTNPYMYLEQDPLYGGLLRETNSDTSLSKVYL